MAGMESHWCQTEGSYQIYSAFYKMGNSDHACRSFTIALWVVRFLKKWTFIDFRDWQSILFGLYIMWPSSQYLTCKPLSTNPPALWKPLHRQVEVLRKGACSETLDHNSTLYAFYCRLQQVWGGVEQQTANMAIVYRVTAPHWDYHPSIHLSYI